jgi:DNA polymerase-3 subunit alpha
VPAGYFRNSKIRIQEIALIGLKHINEASDAIRQQFGEKQTATVSKQSFQKIKKGCTDFVHLHNTFSVLQSTISIPQLVKAASKEKCLQLP